MVFIRSIAFDEERIGAGTAAEGSSSAHLTSDSDFVVRLQTGDAEAFDTLITRYAPEIHGLLYRLTLNAEEAADLTQETFLSAFKAIKGFRGDSELKTWLYRIAVNQSRNRYRWWKRRQADKSISLDELSSPTDRPMSEDVADLKEGPEAELLRRERHHELAAALNKLPEAFRIAVVLCDIEGMSYEEISRMLDVNLGTVKSRIARGRDELRRRLGGI
ncbi:MAG: sigma-70 family RNA polymerase sigma factor [Acidobacteriota bacterium]